MILFLDQIPHVTFLTTTVTNLLSRHIQPWQLKSTALFLHICITGLQKLIEFFLKEKNTIEIPVIL